MCQDNSNLMASNQSLTTKKSSGEIQISVSFEEESKTEQRQENKCAQSSMPPSVRSYKRDEKAEKKRKNKTLILKPIQENLEQDSISSFAYKCVF